VKIRKENEIVHELVIQKKTQKSTPCYKENIVPVGVT